MSLEDRIKLHEKASQNVLPPRMPIIARVDGCHFSSYTKGLKTPFSINLHNCLKAAAEKVTSEIGQIRVTYLFSDECSWLITPYNRFSSEAPYGGRLDKLNSIISSIFTAEFNKIAQTIGVMQNKPNAYFDCRCFPLPKEEVANYFLWRYRDCKQNAILNLGQSHFSQNELNGIKPDQILTMLSAGEYEESPNEFKFGHIRIKAISGAATPFDEAMKLIELVTYYQEEK